MSDPKETTDKTGDSGKRKPLSLKRSVDSGHIQQKFPRGRSKSVEVVIQRKRTIVGPDIEATSKGAQTISEKPATVQPTTPDKAAVARQRTRPVAPQRPSKPTEPGAPNLSEGELEARARALAAAQHANQQQARLEDEQRKLIIQRSPDASEPATPEPAKPEIANPETTAQVQDASVSEAPPQEGLSGEVATPHIKEAPHSPPQSGPDTNRPVASQPIPERRPAARHGQSSSKAEGAPRRDSTREQGRRQPPAHGADLGPLLPSIGLIRPEIVVRDRPKKAHIEPAIKDSEKPIVARPRPPRVAELVDDDEGDRKRSGGKTARPPRGSGDDTRFRGRLTITNALDESQRQRSIASLKRRREREKIKAMGPQQREKIVREVIIPEAITIQDLANRMTERAVDVIRYLMQQGAMHKINDVIDADTAELIVTEFGHTGKRVSEADVEEGFIGNEDASEDLEHRPPVVTIMGHVDHGKTSLLDALRQTNVVSGEAGGITQHIGAYQVVSEEGHRITFIDTPGHEAFTAMRARGARVTDIVILVVAADDGVMPQTIEAINHAKAAGVPLIVAINKIDKPGVDPTRVRTDLLQHEIVVESMGGDTLEVEVSALKRINLDKLLEAINLQAEVLELKANPNRSAEGFVIEAKLERGRGPVGTLLVQRGTLKVGDIVVAGASWGRVRALINDKGQNVATAGPSFPVEVLGFDSAPEAGDQFAVVENEQRAREITDYRVRKRRDALGAAGAGRTLEQMMQQLKEADRKEVMLLIKGDVQGSVEAIAGALKKLGTDEVEARIVHDGVGGITESDVSLASASNAVIIGFNVRANAQARTAAEREGIEIRYYNVIYDLVDDVKAAMSGLLSPTIKENFIGYAEILEVFNISKVGKVAGCRITEGRVERGAGVRLLRDNVVIHQGKLSTLKRFKDEVKEVQVGQECGMAFENYQDIRKGDVIECFTTETIARSL